MLPWQAHQQTGDKHEKAGKPDWLPKHSQRKPRLQGASSKVATGTRWEAHAQAWLEERGLTLVGRQIRCRQGEIDLIMQSGQTAVVVEVRRRADTRWGTARESITYEKRKKIVRTALWWWGVKGRFFFKDLRFDTLTFEEEAQPIWLTHAFDIEGSV
jgi:putative endonuclease